MSICGFLLPGSNAIPIDGLGDIQPRQLFLNGLGVFLRGACVEDQNAFVGLDGAAPEQDLQRAHADRRFWTERHPFLGSRQLHPLRNIPFRRGQGGAAAFPNRIQDHEIAHRRRHAQAAGDGGRILELLREPLPLLEGDGDGRAPVALAGDHPWSAGRVEPAQGLQFLKGLPHPDEPGAAARRIQNHVGQFPIELLGQFEPHRLLAFDAIRLLERRDIKPALHLLALAHQRGRNP